MPKGWCEAVSWRPSAVKLTIPCKYLNNIIEQDHRRIKRKTRPMLGFKNFYAAQRTLAGIEVMAMIKKGQMKTLAGNRKTPAEMFYALAA